MHVCTVHDVILQSLPECHPNTFIFKTSMYIHSTCRTYIVDVKRVDLPWATLFPQSSRTRLRSKSAAWSLVVRDTCRTSDFA